MISLMYQTQSKKVPWVILSSILECLRFFFYLFFCLPLKFTADHRIDLVFYIASTIGLLMHPYPQSLDLFPIRYLTMEDKGQKCFLILPIWKIGQIRPLKFRAGKDLHCSPCYCCFQRHLQREVDPHLLRVMLSS